MEAIAHDSPTGNTATTPTTPMTPTTMQRSGSKRPAAVQHKQPAGTRKNPVVEFPTKQRSLTPSDDDASHPGRFTRWWRAHRPSDRALGWIAPLIVALFGGFIRFFRLGEPSGLVFDESYYVKDAWAMLQTGDARLWPERVKGVDIDTLFAMGQTNLYESTASNIFTHPPLGKWLIAAGMKLFGGATPFAWRFTAALAGTIAILLIARVALRLFHNVTIATTAAIFMAFDGQAITMSRTAMLDGFLMVFVLGAFLCLLNHRDWALRRLQAAHERDVARPGMVVRSEPLADRERRGEGGDTYAPAGRPSVRLVVASSGPVVAFSWWRLAAFVLLGLATGVKWSGGYFLAIFAVISVLWDGYNRRTVGYRRWFGAAIAKDGLLTALYAIPAYALTYLACWTSWFMTPDADHRHWALEHPGQGVTWLPDTLRSLIRLHIVDYQAAAGITRVHPRSSSMLTWPLQLSSTTLMRTNLIGGAIQSPGLCKVTPLLDCTQTVTNVGNPVVWWIGTPCLVLAVVWAIVRKGDWRMPAVLSGFIAGWVPWFAYLTRSAFAYYSVCFLPWVILGTCYALDWLARRGKTGSLTRTAICLDISAIAVGLYLYPIWTGMPLSVEGWLMRMIVPGWIQNF